VYFYVASVFGDVSHGLMNFLVNNCWEFNGFEASNGKCRFDLVSITFITDTNVICEFAGSVS
jgi:hypothetical protein